MDSSAQAQQTEIPGVVSKPVAAPSRRTFTVPLLGAVVTGLTLAALGGGIASLERNATAELAPIAVSQLDEAARTLNAQQAGQLTADAKGCRAPLAYVSLWSTDGSNQTVRIRSGSYVSPAFVLTGAPQRVAVPFPTPYATGRGTLSVEGRAANVAVSLAPTWEISTLAGSSTINIIWNPKSLC